jgi:acetylornithine deacetylase/succinyl-diaminopimelate desuccinylase-like protein
MKNMVAMSAMVMLLLRRNGVALKRDVIFAGVADEEAGCTFGSMCLAEHHPELIRAEYALSEIGGFTLHNAGRRFYPVQIAEKGLCWMTITAKGTAGHGSIPNRDNAIGHIARAAHLLATRRLPHHCTPVVANQLRTLADNLPIPNSIALRALLSKPLCDHVLDHVLPDKNLAATFDAVLHNTANPTILRGGEKINSVPGEASLRVDGRLLPGQTGADLVREIQALIGDEYTIVIDTELPPVVGDGTDPIARTIADVIGDHDPGGIPVQTMIPGFTDAKAYSRLGAKCWGFSPVRLPAGVSFSAMFHGDDERIPVDGFHWGQRALLDLVLRLAT